MDPRTNLTQPWSEDARRKGYQAGLRLTKEFGNWKALAAVAYDKTTYWTDGCTTSNPDFATGEAIYNCRQSGFGPLWDRQVRFDLTGTATLFGMEHYMAMGYRQSGQAWKSLKEGTAYNFAPYQTQNIYNPRTYPEPVSGTPSPSQYRSTFADELTYFQDRITLAPKWDLWAGVGYVENDGQHGPTEVENQLPLTHAVIPSGALIFKPSDAHSYYFSYSEGLSRTEIVDGSDPTIANPGDEIPGVHSKAYEVGAKWLIAQRLQLNLAVFKMEQPFVIQELVSTVPLLYRRYAGGMNEFTGVSIDFRGQLTRSLQIQGGFTTVDPVQKDTPDPAAEGKNSPGVAHDSGVLNLTWDMGSPGGVSIDGGIYYQGGMPLDPLNTFDLDGFTRVDMGATYETEWGDNEVRMRLLLENALDDEFYYGFQSGFQLAAPRTLNASIAVRF
jgi:iron complex outermembrane receptor protein